MVGSFVHAHHDHQSGMKTLHMSWGREGRGGEGRGGEERSRGRGGEGEGRGKGVRGQEGNGDGKKPFICACVRGRIDCC